MAEEYDPWGGRCFRGNFPQAFSRVALINLTRAAGQAPAHRVPRAAGAKQQQCTKGIWRLRRVSRIAIIR